jgi:lysophospholipid acyltransferase (LPLAT)-like uncharacterized protein
MRWLNRWVGRIGAALLVVWRRTCRYRVVNDPRPALRAAEVPYIYALLHAHQISAVFVNDERRGRLAAMVSRSADGDLLVPSLTARGVLAVRGSSRRGSVDKGGQQALSGLRELLEQRIAVLLAVDGPRGPRNEVKPGVAQLAQQVAGAAVLPTVVLPSRRRWFHSWDRMQVPMPFCTVSLIFAEPVRPRPDEATEALRERISSALNGLEALHDPGEAALAEAARRTREAAA